jgi:lipopolysaccharide export system permease protein
MSILSRYLIRQMVGPMVFATLALTGVIWLTQSLRVIDRIVNQGLPFGSFLYMTILLLPNILTMILPIAMFGALLFAYNRLFSDSELVVMRAVGWNDWALARPALIVAGAITAIVAALALWLGPWGLSELRATQYEFRTNLSAILLQEGVFNNPSSGLTVYVRQRDPGGELHGILVHDNRDPQKPVTIMAESGALVRTPEGPRFVMVNGNRQQIEQSRHDIGLLYFDSYTLDLKPYLQDEGAGWRDPGERPLGELLAGNFTTPDDRANASRLTKEAHRRLAAPLMVPALTLIALAAVLGGEFSRRGQNLRLIVAALGALAVEVTALAANYLAGKTLALVPLLYLAPIAFIAGAAFLLFRPVRPRRRANAPSAPAEAA